MDIDALKVVGRLRRHGHTAYLVGGCVRDLLLGRKPKDYDVGTTARPRQVKQLFRNSRIIGRRFRLVHVVFGRKVIEVATFRSQEEDSRTSRAATGKDDGDGGDLLIRTDNVYGSPEEDAFRRDFTVNGLFYEPESGEVIDYVKGLDDLDRRVIRTIGEPDIRMQEDPVRMIRAVKFAARLGFAIDPKTYDAMISYRGEVERAATPRVAEEIVRLAQGGRALESFRLFADLGLFPLILPRVWDAVAGGASGFFDRLAMIDKLGAKNFTRATLLAVVYSPLFDALLDSEEAQKTRDFGALFTAAVRPIVSDRLLSRREADRIKQIYVAQRRLKADPKGKRPRGGKGRRRRRRSPIKTLVRREYFREALSFFKIDCMSRGLEAENWERWEKYLDQAPPPGEVDRWKKKGRRGKPKDGDKPQRAKPNGPDKEAKDAKDEAPKKKRKRRRRRRRGKDKQAQAQGTQSPQGPKKKEAPETKRVEEIMPSTEGPGNDQLINPYTGKPYQRSGDAKVGGPAKKKKTENQG